MGRRFNLLIFNYEFICLPNLPSLFIFRKKLLGGWGFNMFTVKKKKKKKTWQN